MYFQVKLNEQVMNRKGIPNQNQVNDAILAIHNLSMSENTGTPYQYQVNLNATLGKTNPTTQSHYNKGTPYQNQISVNGIYFESLLIT